MPVPVNSARQGRVPLAAVQTNEAQTHQPKAKNKYSDRLTRMKKDVLEYNTIKNFWTDGSHYRSALGINKQARTKEVLAEVRLRCSMWEKSSRNEFAIECHLAGLIPSTVLPWSETASEQVNDMWSAIKNEIKEKIADFEQKKQQEEVLRERERQRKAQQQQRQQPERELNEPPMEQLPSVHCCASRRSSSAPALSMVSGIVGIPIVAMPVSTERIISWKVPLIWNEAYNGNLESIKQLVKEDPSLLDSLGYLKTMPTCQVSTAQRLGLRKLRNNNITTYSILPAPPGDDSKATPLHFAIMNGKIDVAKWFIKKGAEMQLSCQQGGTAIQLASKHDNPIVLKTLYKELEKQKGNQKGVLKRIAGIFH